MEPAISKFLTAQACKSKISTNGYGVRFLQPSGSKTEQYDFSASEENGTD